MMNLPELGSPDVGVVGVTGEGKTATVKLHYNFITASTQYCLLVCVHTSAE